MNKLADAVSILKYKEKLCVVCRRKVALNKDKLCIHCNFGLKGFKDESR